MNVNTRISVAIAVLFSLSAAATPASELKEKLQPVVENVLQKHCGDHCPSFKVSVNEAKAAEPGFEDLGFPAGPQAAAPTYSVAVEVLQETGEKSLTPQQQDVLKQVVQYRLAQETDAPVSVRFRSLKGSVPTSAATAPSVAGFITGIAWPVSLILLALIALGAWLLHLRSLKEESTANQPIEDSAASAESDSASSSDLPVERSVPILETHAGDLAFILETAAAAGDKETLSKILSIYPTSEISKVVELGAQTLRALSEASADSGVSETDPEKLNWLSVKLAQAHWKRMEQQADPISVASNWDAQTQKVLISKLTPGARALLLSRLPKKTWADVITRLPSPDRIALGTSLHSVTLANEEQRKAWMSEIRVACDSIQNILRDGGLIHDQVIQDYSLYLSAEESEALNSALSHSGSQVRKAPSTEEFLSSLGDSELVEVCLRLEFDSLKMLYSQCSEGLRVRMLSRLPQALKDRLTQASGPRTAAKDEAALLRTRAEIVQAYRDFSGAGDTN